MKTPFRDGVIDVRLSKPETAIAKKTLAMLQTLAAIHPIRKEISEAAKIAADATTKVLGMVASDAPEYLSLIDGQPKPSHPDVAPAPCDSRPSTSSLSSTADATPPTTPPPSQQTELPPSEPPAAKTESTTPPAPVANGTSASGKKGSKKG